MGSSFPPRRGGITRRHGVWGWLHLSRGFRFIPHDLRVISESVVVTFSYSDVFQQQETSASVSYTSIERSPVIILVYFHATGLTVKKGATELLFWLCRIRVSLPIVPPVGSNATMPQARHMVDLILHMNSRIIPRIHSRPQQERVRSSTGGRF